MADQRITFDFAGQSSGLVSEVKKVQQELKDLEAKSKGVGSSAALDQNAKSASAAGFSVTDLAAKYFLVVQALQGVMAAGKTVYGSLIQQNVELQQQLLGTQSSLAATNKVVSGGIEITDPTEAIQALEGPVNAAVKRIREGSLELVGVTSKDLIPIFQNIAGQSASIGANLNQSADLTLKFAAALGTLNVPIQQQRQEISSILQGQITSDSIVAKTLGITNEQVRQWKAQGTLVNELNQRLEAFSAGNKLAAQSIGGIASNIQEIFDNITLEAGGDLTQQLATELNGIYKLLIDNKDEILAFVQSGADAITSLIGGVKDVGGSILSDGKPAFDQLGGAIANAGGLIESLLLGFGNILKFGGQILGSPVVAWPLELAKNALFGLQAIAALNGQFGQATEAVEIYRQQSARAADEALAALTKTKNGDADAAQARKNAIASLDSQIKTLQESNLVGTENRDVIRGQINELEGLKGKLAGAGSNIKLVSKDTTQLTSDLKLLNETFEAQGQAAQLAQAQLTAAVKRQRTGDKAISAREEQAQLYEIEQEGLNARLKLAEDKAAGIAAIAAKGGDAEQQKQFKTDLIKSQTEQATLEGQIAEKQIARKKAILDLQLKDVETYQAQAQSAIAESETANATQAEQRYQQDLSQKQRYEFDKLTIAQERIQAEIKLEEKRAADLQNLTFTDPDEIEANEAKIRASKQKTADLTLKSLETQRQIEQSKTEIILKLLRDQADQEKNQSDARITQLDAQKQQIDLVTGSIDRQGKLLKAQTDLASAQNNLAATGAQIETDNLTRALEIRKKLNDAQTSPEVRRVLQEQLKILTGKPNTSEAEILAQKVRTENQLQAIKRQSLALEQTIARQNLETELQRNRLANERLVIESKNAKLASEQALNEAQNKLDQLKADPSADPQSVRNAQAAVARATATDRSAAENVGAASANAAQATQLETLSKQSLDAQQLAAKAQFEAADNARLQAAELTLVEAKARNIAQILREVAPAQQLNDRTNQLARQFDQRVQPLNGALVPLPQGAPATQASGASDQLGQLRLLVAIAQNQANLNQETNTHLRAIASRRPAPPQTIVQPVRGPQQYTGNDGLPL